MSDTTNRPENVKLENVRLSFPHLFKPKSFGGDDDSKAQSEPKFRCAFILDKKKNAKTIESIKKAVAYALKDKYGDKIPKGFKGCLRDGSEKEDMDGYGPDVMFVSAGTTKRPVVVDRDRTPLTEDDGKPYAGCYVNASIRVWVQDNKFGKRVNAQLRAVQFAKDGESFGEAPVNADEEFSDLGESESADEGSDLV